ncbi:ABC transporter permease [Curtobacterium sp. S6]|uniref:ABC transporter permease n=1 Tax=Curtobacterium sp. S6 TaxID=1479623 RepID=UPI000B0691B3|nr:ABC transporter permease [Curtobacterium sp. S6]
MTQTATLPVQAREPTLDDAASLTGPQNPPGRARRHGRFAALRGTYAIAAFLLLWEFGPLLGSSSFQVFLPRFHVVAAAWWGLFTSGQLWEHFSASLARSVVGFAIATVLGITLGLLVGWYRVVYQTLNPLLEIFRNTAALALLPVFVLLLGIGELSKVVIVIYAAFFPVLLNTAAGVKTVDPLLIRAGRTLGLSKFRLFTSIVLPGAVPTIFTGVRVAGSAAILVLVAAEMVGAKAGLGFLITSSQNSFLIPQMYAGVITISLLGLVVNTALVALEKRFSRWRSHTEN